MADLIKSDRTLRRHARHTTNLLIESQDNIHVAGDGRSEESRENVIPLETSSASGVEVDIEMPSDNYQNDLNQNHYSSEGSLDESVDPMLSDVGESDSVQFSDSDSDDGFEYDFRQKLKEWAVRSNISHSHINSLLNILRVHFPSLPKDARTLLQTPRKYEINEVAGGKYHHFGIVEGLKNKFESLPYLVGNQVQLKINVDGLPIFKKDSKQFWPILGLLENDKTAEPFIIGLWVGRSKPQNINDFFQYFVEEMEQLDNSAFLFSDMNIHLHVEVSILNFICDAVARSLVKQVKGHCGFYGCEKCTQSGVYINHRMTFPEVHAVLRTDLSFLQMLDEDHHTGISILHRIGIGMVSQFPLDPMHLVFLGVVKKTLLLMIKGPLNVRLSYHETSMISEALESFKSFIPKEFARKGRTLAEVERWKATEFRTFLLFTGPVACKSVLDATMYKNFLMLHVAITVLSSNAVSPTLCDYAEELLISFVQHFAVLYGEETISYNVHNLIHLANDVRKFGPLSNFTAFPFENFMQTLKGMLRKPKYPLEQVVRRLAERNGFPRIPKEKASLKKPHRNGPLVGNIPQREQYKEFYSGKFTFTCSQGDNVVMVGENIFLIRNIVSDGDIVSLVCQRFSNKEPFYHYPLNSLEIKIALVKNLDHDLVLIPTTEQIVKGIMLPYENKFVCFPQIYFA